MHLFTILSIYLFYYRDFFPDASCGNGFVEPGEECDCGSLEECRTLDVSQCCDHTTCKLKAGAQCAQGHCCQQCKFKERGAVCREKLHPDCDLEEHCTGTSEQCGDNFYVGNGEPCNNSTSYCYRGNTYV